MALLQSVVPPSEEDVFERIACALERVGYAVLPDSLPHTIRYDLLGHLQTLEQHDFHRAKTGRGLDESVNAFVRRDRIVWLERSDEQARSWFDWCDRLKQYLNKRLFLGLFSFESQMALYEPGAFYKKHYDAFRGQSNRVLSLVAYLNSDWSMDQGGELVIFASEDEQRVLVKVQPQLGTLVIFLSEEFPHEVLSTQRSRYSVAGWFRVNGSINNEIDPPR